MTSPYAFYQFWLNTADADVIDRLKVFTFLTRAEIMQLQRAVVLEPHKREAQRTLAREVTTLVHGPAATEAAIAASAALFGNGDLAAVEEDTLAAALRELPTAPGAEDLSVVEALVSTGLAKSASDARRAIAQGGVYVNNVKVASADALVGPLLHGRFSVLRRGKKTLAGIANG